MTDDKPRVFDAAASARVDRIYQNPDIVVQRAFVRQHLDLQVGEHVMDIGAGPGLLALEMAEEVGDSGHVIALEPSADMRTIAEHRCQTTPWVSIVDGDAVALPADDESLDAIVTTQVYEYVPDSAAALGEALRVLKPGGRLIILDTDWDSAVVNTSDRARMATVLDAYRSHFYHSDLPGRLPKLIKDGGFDLRHAGGTPIVNTRLGNDTYAGDVVRGIAKYAERKAGIAPEICTAWLQEQEDLNAEGAFFFSITRFLFQAVKPK